MVKYFYTVNRAVLKKIDSKTQTNDNKNKRLDKLLIKDSKTGSQFSTEILH